MPIEYSEKADFPYLIEPSMANGASTYQTRTAQTDLRPMLAVNQGSYHPYRSFIEAYLSGQESHVLAHKSSYSRTRAPPYR